MQANPYNRNQTLFFDGVFQGLPVMQEKGPFVIEYLEALFRVMNKTLDDHRRVCAIRFDLHFPLGMDADNDAVSNTVITRFIESLKAKIRHHRDCARQRNNYAHDTRVRYIWAREVGLYGRVHYHFVLLLNREAYFTLGQFPSDDPNMANRIMEAWASALGLPIEQASSLVHFPGNPLYRFERGMLAEIAPFFHRASYLCKSTTKQFGNGNHGFGASRH